MKNMKTAHPMPDKRREKWLNLNGAWEFSFDKPTYDKTIEVPFTWTSQLSGVEEDKKGAGYYRKKVSYHPSMPRLFLIIGACDYETKVTVNGQELVTHLGGYDPIECEVTAVWRKDAENVIEVYAYDDDSKAHTYGKQGYGNIRGIWQTVYLEERPESYVESFVIRTALSGEVTIRAAVNGRFDCLKADFEGFHAENNGNELLLKVDEPHLWSPDDPKLYEGTLTLENGGETDLIHTYFGIREVGSVKCANGRRYFALNGKPIYVNSTLDQSFNPQGFFTLPSDEEEENEILRMKALGLNSARIHIKTEEPLKLYYADKHGLMIIQDIPCYWGEPTEEARSLFDAQMMACMNRDINHPAIVHWVLYNETWGLFTGEGENRRFLPETQAWVRANYEKAKALDPTRLVEDHSVCNEDHVVTDIDTWHFYSNGYKEVKKVIGDFCEKSYVGSTYNFIGGNTLPDIPVMNSECGNVWGIDGNAGDSDMAWHYKYMINEFRLHDLLSGFVFTEFHDVVNEFNGYYRIDNSPKIFGYEEYVPGMSMKDLHSGDFLAYELAPMTTVKAGEKCDLPLYISSFTDKNHGKTLLCEAESVMTDANGRKTILEKTVLPVKLEAYGLTKVGSVSLAMPQEEAVVTVRLRLRDADGGIIMRNFVNFDVRGAVKGKEIPLASARLEGRGGLRQNQRKLNVLAGGRATFVLSPADLLQNATLIFEASARETFTRDLAQEERGAAGEGNYMLGYKVDRGANENCFFMTTEGKQTESTLTLYANGEKCGEFLLPDDPADSRGALSWHYQENPRRLDEAGTYGWLCKAVLPEKLLKAEKIELTFASDNGFTLFGRESGRYPTGVRIE